MERETRKISEGDMTGRKYLKQFPAKMRRKKFPARAHVFARVSTLWKQLLPGLPSGSINSTVFSNFSQSLSLSSEVI